MDADPIALVRAAAHLARLDLAEAELERLAPQLARILEAFRALERFPARTESAAEPALDRSRADEPAPSLPREAVLAAAPARENGFFVVPRTVGGEP